MTPHPWLVRPTAGSCRTGSKYHQAAYQNATDLGSPAVQRHEAHFQEVINGELKETRYYQGRMTQSATIAPSERTTEFSTFGG